MPNLVKRRRQIKSFPYKKLILNVQFEEQLYAIVIGGTNKRVAAKLTQLVKLIIYLYMYIFYRSPTFLC